MRWLLGVGAVIAVLILIFGVTTVIVAAIAIPMAVIAIGAAFVGEGEHERKRRILRDEKTERDWAAREKRKGDANS